MVLNANGIGNEGTDVRIGGVSDVNAWVQVNSNAVPSVEVIQMVEMVTNSPGVAQGLASGATINVQIKSGTNQFHGEVYEYHEDNAREARPFFLPGNQGKPKSSDNDFGGALGGPIVKNKLFFFAGFDSAYGPGAVNLDLSLLRDFKLSDRRKHRSERRVLTSPTHRISQTQAALFRRCSTAPMATVPPTTVKSST